ncbi:NHL domain-containing protein [Kutzneria chonburiensis]
MRSRWIAGALATVGLLTVLAPVAQARPSGLGIVTTLAGDGYARYPRPGVTMKLLNPEGVVVRNGSAVVADTFNHRILRMSSTGQVDLVAGTGDGGFSGDGGDPQAARLNVPMGPALDASGAVYFADRDNNRVRKVAADGSIVTTIAGGAGGSIVTTIAGGAGGGFGGDGGPATAAGLASPNGVAVDQAGNVFIADTFDNRIRKVSPQGVISTVAGSGPTGPFDGAYAGDGGPATNARLNQPTSVAVAGDSTLYIADTGHGRIRRVTPAGVITTYSTVAAGAVSLDPSGNLLTATRDNQIMRIPLSGPPTFIAGNGSSTSSGDGGPATAAGVASPTGVAMDTDGSMFITQADSHVRKVAISGTISTPAGGGTAIPAVDGPVAGIAVQTTGIALAPDGAIVIADHYRIRRLANGVFSTLAGTGVGGTGGDGGPATQAQFSGPSGIVLAPDGSLYVADANVIRKVYPDGTIRRYAGTGAYGFSGDGGPATQATFRSLGGLALDGAGNLYVADTSNERVRRINPDGIVTTVAGSGDRSGPLGDGGPALMASLYEPDHVGIDAAGALYIADPGNVRLRKVANGTITTVAGNGQDSYSGDGGPATAAGLHVSDFAWDAAGVLYVLDSHHQRIRRITPDGLISTVAGTGVIGFNGDNQLATATQLTFPNSIRVGRDGSVYFGDGYGLRLRKITFNG